MDQDDIKWKSVETTSREILYFTNKITGQQKWTNKNCYCSKPKDPLRPTLPCCFKTSSLTHKSTGEDLTEFYARKQHKALVSKKLYCLSDIANEVQKSFLSKGHRKHKRRGDNITLDFKKKLIVNEDPKIDVRITKDSRSDQTNGKSKDDVIIVDFQNDVSISKDVKIDIKTTNNFNNDSNFAIDSKDNVNAKDDSSCDVNFSEDPPPLSKEPKDDVVGTKVTQNDVTTVDDVGSDITVVKDPKDVYVLAHRKNDVSEAKDSAFDNENTVVKDITTNKENDTSKEKDSNDVLSNEPSKRNVASMEVSDETTGIDVNTTDDLNNDITVVKEPKDVTVTMDKENDNSEAKGSNDVLSNEPSKRNDVSMEVSDETTGIDVNTTDDLNNDVTVVKEPKDVTVTMDKENDNSEAKGSNDVLSNEPSKRNDVSMEVSDETTGIDVNTTDDLNNDVTVVKEPKDVTVTMDKENDNSEAKGSNDVSNEPSKLNKKVIMYNRGLKRKKKVSENVNGYKGRLRVRQNKIKMTLRRKYTRRKPLKTAGVSNESVQFDCGDNSKNPSKKKKLEVENKVLLAHNYDLIEQSIIEIDRFISGFSAKDNKPSSDLESQRLKSEGAESGTLNANPENENTNPDLKTALEKNHSKISEVPVEVSQPRFIDEQFVQMNIPLQSLAEVDNEKSRTSKTIGSVQKKAPVSGRKRQKVLPMDLSPNRPVVTKMSSSPVSRRQRQKVLPIVLSAHQRHSKHLSDDGTLNSSNKADENSSSKTLSSSDLVNTDQYLSLWGKCNFPPKRSRSNNSLNDIVNRMNSPNKVEVSLKSTMSMSSWLTTLSKESKEVSKSNPETNDNNFSRNGSSLSTEKIGGFSCADDVGADCPEADSSVYGHIKEAFSLSSKPQTPSIELVSQGGSQLSLERTNNSRKPGSQKGEAGRRSKKTCDVSTNTTVGDLLFQTPEQARNVTEVPASHVDLSWRIVTSNDGHSSSLSNFFKLVPITIARGPSGTVDIQEPRSFLGVPIHGGPAVIAKILNTSVAQNCNEVFTMTRKPSIVTGGTYVKKSTLSFVWDNDAVLVNSESLKAGTLSGKHVKPRPPIWIDTGNRVSIILPKPLRLPEAGNIIYLGDFNVEDNQVEFVVTHSVLVTSSPRPSLTVPSGTPVNSSSTVSRAVRCRSPVKAKYVAQATKKVLVGRETPKGDTKTFQKCVFCGTELRCQRDRKIHRKLHASFAGTKCSECKRRFRDGGRLSVHLDTHKCNWFHVCDMCNKPYRTPKFLTSVDLAKDYYKMCLPCRRKELKCKKCTERLLTFKDLELHLKEKHGLQCPICKCSFLFKRDLSKHMSNEHGITITPSLGSTNTS